MHVSLLIKLNSCTKIPVTRATQSSVTLSKQSSLTHSKQSSVALSKQSSMTLLRYDGLHLPHANHKFGEVNAKYQLHKSLRAISHPLYAKERVFLIREEVTAIEVRILNISLHQFSMFVKMAFVNSYRVDCNLVNCINNCNR